MIKGQLSDPKILSLVIVYSLSSALGISPLEVYRMPAELVMDLLAVHREFEIIKQEEMEKIQKQTK